MKTSVALLFLFFSTSTFASFSINLDTSASPDGWVSSGVMADIDISSNTAISLSGDVYASSSTSLGKSFSADMDKKLPYGWSFGAGLSFMPELDNYSQFKFDANTGKKFGNIWAVIPELDMAGIKHTTSFFSIQRQRFLNIYLNQISFTPSLALKYKQSSRIDLSFSINRYSVQTPSGSIGVNELSKDYDTTTLKVLITTLRLSGYDSLFVDNAWTASYTQDLSSFLTASLYASGNSYLFPENGKTIRDNSLSCCLTFYFLERFSTDLEASYDWDSLSNKNWTGRISITMDFP